MHRILAKRTLLAALGCSLALAAGCQRQTPPEGYVARVGDIYLMQDETHAALDNLPPRLDSTEARRQFIDQWVTNELLFQEALRLNLRTREDVQRRLEESERSVLIDALVSQLFEEETETPFPAEIRAYFERHKEQLRLREPFARVRYLFTTEADSAQIARSVLQQAPPPAASDSIWALLVSRFAEDPARKE